MEVRREGEKEGRREGGKEGRVNSVCTYRRSVTSVAHSPLNSYTCASPTGCVVPESRMSSFVLVSLSCCRYGSDSLGNLCVSQHVIKSELSN